MSYPYFLPSILPTVVPSLLTINYLLELLLLIFHLSWTAPVPGAAFYFPNLLSSAFYNCSTCNESRTLSSLILTPSLDKPMFFRKNFIRKTLSMQDQDCRSLLLLMNRSYYGYNENLRFRFIDNCGCSIY